MARRLFSHGTQNIQSDVFIDNTSEHAEHRGDAGHRSEIFGQIDLLVVDEEPVRQHDASHTQNDLRLEREHRHRGIRGGKCQIAASASGLVLRIVQNAGKQHKPAELSRMDKRTHHARHTHSFFHPGIRKQRGPERRQQEIHRTADKAERAERLDGVLHHPDTGYGRLVQQNRGDHQKKLDGEQSRHHQIARSILAEHQTADNADAEEQGSQQEEPHDEARDLSAAAQQSRAEQAEDEQLIQIIQKRESGQLGQ